MADLSRNAADLPIVIIGATTSGVAETPVGSDVNGNLLVKDYNNGPVTAGTVAPVSGLIGGQYNTTLPTVTNTQQVAVQVDNNGRLIVNPATFSYFHPVYTTRVQTAAAANSAATASLSVTLNPTQAGSLLVVNAYRKTSTVTITDSAAQTYTALQHQTSGTANTYMFYTANTAAGVTSVTITCSAGTDELLLIVTEYANVLTSSPADQTTSNTNTAVTSWTSGTTSATTQASELIIGNAQATLHAATTFTAGSGYTAVNEISNAAGGSNMVAFMEEKYVTTTGTQAATGTNSTSDTILAAVGTFKLGTLPSSFSIVGSPTVIKSGQGSLMNVIVNTAGTAPANVIFYDGTNTSGTVIATLSLAQQGSYDYNLRFTNGLTMVASSNIPDFTVVYE